MMTSPADRLATALADRYTIERQIGAGGMATVYLAHDVKHDRKVAVKVLKPELAAVLGADRFLNEFKVTANLQHPHILPLHDSGEVEGFVYYVMPYVEGESLRGKLNREKQLAMDETIALTQQVAAALDYAHEAGAIHRDIKPENILLHEGEALVADFGIALAVSAAGGTRLTVDPGWVGEFYTLALSPDGSRLAVALDGDAGRDLWVKQLDKGPLSRLTFHEGDDERPWWTEDGRSVLFVSDRGETRDLYRRRADGVGQAEPVLVLPEIINQGQFSPDGQWLVYRTGPGYRGPRTRSGEGSDIYARHMRGDTGTIALVADPNINEHSPALSPDGKWLAYVSDESGRWEWELYVRLFPNVDDGRWQVSTAGGSEPVWAHSGRELFYKNAVDELVSSEVRTSPTFMLGQHRILFSAADYYSWPWHPQYDVTADDQRFVMLREVTAESYELVLVLNWFEELKQRVGK